MPVNQSDVRRCIGHYSEYPGAYAWPEYEYLCPKCNKWNCKISDISLHHDDNTKNGFEQWYCEPCGEIIAHDFVSAETNSQTNGAYSL